jgi:hypothetical protein
LVTYVGGSENCIADIVNSPQLEAFPIRVDLPTTWDKDTLNAINPPVPLQFETTEQNSGLPPGHQFTITGVGRDDYGIRIKYTLTPPPPSYPPAGPTPYAEGRDDRDHDYEELEGRARLAEAEDHIEGVITMPLPEPDASVLHVRIRWSQDPPLRLRDRPAHELRIKL